MAPGIPITLLAMGVIPASEGHHSVTETATAPGIFSDLHWLLTDGLRILFLIEALILLTVHFFVFVFVICWVVESNEVPQSGENITHN
jgi:hypothetical protein